MKNVNPFDKHFHSFEIICEVDFSSTRLGRKVLPLHDIQKHFNRFDMMRKECITNQHYVLVEDPSIPDDLRQECYIKGFTNHVGYKLIAKCPLGEAYLGTFNTLERVNAVIERCSFDGVVKGLYWQISADHLPEEVLENLINFAFETHPREYQAWKFTLIPFPDYWNVGECDSLAIRFANTPWSKEDCLKIRKQLRGKGLDKRFIDVVILAGQAGIGMLVFEPDGRVIEGLPVYNTDKEVKYLRHILHDQIESEKFWLNEMASWETDEAGNTPQQQFELILEPATKEQYLAQEAECKKKLQEINLNQESEI